MTRRTWGKSLRQTLTRLARADRATRVAIVGVGQALHGDDAVGVVVARVLRRFVTAKPHLLIIDAGSAPENYTGALRRFQPDLVLLIDAAHMSARAGAIRWLAWQETIGISASSHTLPLHMVASYMQTALLCEVVLLGVQPEDSTLGLLSPSVRRAATMIIGDLATILD